MADERVHDKYVAEAQFDSRDFDKNIRKSQKTLEDFKKSLNFEDAVGQMQDLQHSSGLLSGMAKNLKKLTNEIAGIGSISAFVQQKIQAAWHGAANSVENFAKSLTSVQRQAGAEKYDKLLKAVQTIKNATGDAEEYVYGVMEKLNKYTDETSYDFADMAQNIGKFTTAGIHLKDAEEEMEGIANWAALAGQGVGEAQRAMYNLSQAMSAGYLLKIDYKSIQNANMDIRKFREEALKAAAEVGTLIEKNGVYKTKKGGKTVDVENFVETLQFKWFDKATMEKVFKTFADNTKGIGAEAYKAAQRCVTLKDALNAIKDMLSTGWMKSYQLVFGRLSEAMDLFSGLCNKASAALQDFIDTRNGILEHWNVGGGRDSLWAMLVGEIETPDGKTLFRGAYGLLDLVVDVSDMVKEAFRSFVRMFIREENLAIYDSNPDYMFAYLGSVLSEFTGNVQKFMDSIGTFLHEVPEGAMETRFEQIKHVVEAVYAAIMWVFNLGHGIVQFIGQILGQLTPAFDAVQWLLTYLAQLFTGDVVKGAKENVIGKFFKNLAELLRPVTTVINVVVVVLTRLIAAVVGFVHQTGLLPALLQTLSNIVGLVGQAFVKILTSDMFKDFITWIGNLVAKIPAAVQRLRDFGKMIIDTVKKTKTFGLFWGWVESTFGGKSLDDVWHTISGRFSKLTSRIPELLPELQDNLRTIWGKIVGVLDQFFGTIIGFFVGSAKADEAAESVNDAIVAVLTPGSGADDTAAGTAVAGSLISQIKDAFNRVWIPVKDFVSNFFSVTVPSFFKSDAVKAVGKFFEGTTFMGLLGGVTNLIKWLAIFRTGSGLVAAGKGIKKLGIGLKVFGKNLKKFNLVGAFKDMFTFTNTINSNNTDNSRTSNWGKFGDNLLKTAIGIGIVVIAAIKLSDAVSKLTPEQLKNTGVTLAALVGGLVTADIMSGKLGGGGKGLLKLAAAVGILVYVLKQLSTLNIAFREVGATSIFDKWTPFTKALLTLTGMIITLSFAGALAGKAGAKGLMKLAIAVEILVLVVKQLMRIAVFREVGAKGLLDKWTPFTKALATLAGLILTLSIAGRLAGNGAKGLLGFSVAIEVLVLVLKQLSKIAVFRNLDGSLTSFSKAIITLTVIIGVLTAASFVISHFGKEGLKGLGKVVLAIAALALVGAMIAQMKPEQILYGFGALVALMLAMGGFVAMASKIDPAKMKAIRGIFISFALTVGIITAALVLITELGVQESAILKYFGGLVAVLLGMALIIRAARKVQSGKALGALAIAFGGLFAVVAAITASLILIQDKGIQWEMLLTMMSGITAIVVAMGTFMPLLSKMSISGAAIAVVAIAATIAAIMVVIGLLAEYLLGKIGNALSSISARLKITSGLLADFFNRMEGISVESVQHAQKIFDMLKDLIVSVAGFALYSQGVQSLEIQLNKLGAGLDLFFLNDSKYPDPESSNSFKALDKLIAIGPSLGTFNVGNVPADIFALGTALGLFDAATSGITTDNPPALGLMTGLFSQADNIQTIMSLPLTELANKLELLGSGMSLYAKGSSEVTGVKADSGIISISEAVGILNEVIGAMNEEGGLQSFTIPEGLPEEQETASFSLKLNALAVALGEFIDAASNYTGTTQQAVDMLGMLKDINSNLTSDRLKFISVLGPEGVTYDMLSEFALDIGQLGYALGEFAKNVDGADFSTGISALQSMQTINSLLTTDRLNFIKAFEEAGLSGAEDYSPLSQFSTDIAELGRALGGFAQSLIMDDGTEANFDNAIKALGFLGRLQTKLGALQNIGGLLNTFLHGETQTIGTLSGQLTEMGQALGDFSDAMSGIGEGKHAFDYEAVNNGLSSLEALIGVINHMTMVNPQTNNIFGAEFFIRNLAEITSAINDVEYLNKQGYGNGKSVAQNLAEFCKQLSDAINEVGGLDEGALDMFAKVSNAINTLLTLDPTMDFENTGRMIAAGIKQGIEQGQSDVVQSVIDVVQAAIDAGKDVAQIASPSKVTEEMGEFLDQGLAKGLTNEEQTVVNASEDVVYSMLDTVSKNTIGKWMTDIFPKSNAGLLSRPLVDAAKLAEAGWEDAGEGIATVFSSTFGAGKNDGDFYWNQDVVFDMTPITPDGKVLTPAELESYALSLLGKSQSIRELIANDQAKNGGLDLLLNVDTDFKGLDEGYSKAEHMMVLLHQLQEAYYLLDEEENPLTITPVLDLSVAEKQMNQYESGYFQWQLRQHQLNTDLMNARAEYMASQTGPAQVVIQNPSDFPDPLAAINELGLQLNDLGNQLTEKIGNMKLYLNTGVVAGGVTDDVGMNLGRKDMYAARRN